MKPTILQKITILLLLCSFGLSPKIHAQDDQLLTINFETAKSVLPDSTIQYLVAQANRWEKYTIFLQGHTDDVGAADNNLKLAAARVQTIQEVLQQQGIDSSRIQTVAWGASQPIADNMMPEGRAKNRRVEILLTANMELYKAQQDKLDALLSKLISQRGKTHVIKDPTKATTIRAKQGTIVRIPANAFDSVERGQTVVVKVTEVYQKSDMILYNLGTISNGKPLQTGGMIKVEAFANGKPIQLQEGKALDIEVPTKDPREEMKLFSAQLVNNNINWVDPKPLTLSQSIDTTREYDWSFVIPEGIYKQYPTRVNKPKFLRKPVEKDSFKIAELQKKYQRFETDPFRTFAGHTTEKTFFGKKKVARTAADSVRYLAYVEKSKQNIVDEIEKIRAYSTRYKQEQKVYKVYEQKMANYNAYRQSCDRIMRENLAIAIEHNDRHQIVGNFIYLMGEEKIKWKMKAYGLTKQELYIFDQKEEKQKDAYLCQRAIANNDTFALNMLQFNQHKIKLAKHIYQKQDIDEAYKVHLKYRDLPKYMEMAKNLGITVDSAVALEAYQKIRAAEITAVLQKASYNFQITSLGRFVNCDFFPGMAPQEELITSNLVLPVPFSFTRTYMVFDQYNVVMPSSGLEQKSYWRNVPLQEPVRIVSLYIDEKDETYLAIQTVEVANNEDALEYKKVTEQELQQALLQLNKTAT